MEGNHDNQHPYPSGSHDALSMAHSLDNILRHLRRAPVNPDATPVPSCTVGHATPKRDGSMEPTPTKTVVHRLDRQLMIKINVPAHRGDQYVRLPFVPKHNQPGPNQWQHSLFLSIILIGESTNSVHGGAGFYFQHDKDEDLDFDVQANAKLRSIAQSGSIFIPSGQEGLIYFKFKRYPCLKNEADTAYRILLTLHDSQGDLVSYNLTGHGYRVVSRVGARQKRKIIELDGADHLESTSARKRHRNNEPSLPPPNTIPDTQIPSSSGSSFGSRLSVPSTTAINPALVTQNPQYLPAASSVADTSYIPPPVALGGPAAPVSLPSGNELTSPFPVLNPLLASQTVLTNVTPDRGCVIGGNAITLVLTDPPEERNIYARFGTVVVNTEWLAANVRRCIVPPAMEPGAVDVTLSYGPSLNDPQIGFSMSTYTYEVDQVKKLNLKLLQAYKDLLRFSGGQYTVNHCNLSAPPADGSPNGPTYPEMQHSFNSRTDPSSINSHSPCSRILTSGSESEVGYGPLERHRNDVKMHHETSVRASTKPLPPLQPKTFPVDRDPDVSLLHWKIRKWLTSIEALSDFGFPKPATPFPTSSLRLCEGTSPLVDCRPFRIRKPPVFLDDVNEQDEYHAPGSSVAELRQLSGAGCIARHPPNTRCCPGIPSVTPRPPLPVYHTAMQINASEGHRTFDIFTTIRGSFEVL